MIERGITLYPQEFDYSQMYYEDQPFGYWLSVPSINFYEWILYKEYNDYRSVCNPNDCLSAISYEEVIESLKTYSFYEGLDRDKLCKAFRQRSLFDDPYDFEDFEGLE